MAKDLLLEIGLEEVPARFVRGAMNQLQERMSKWLTEARLAHAGIEAYATPRRLALQVRELAEQQTDLHEEVKGPSRKIALDAQGAWSKAALGFARSQGVAPEALFFRELQGVEYVYANKSSIGAATDDVLAEGLLSIITGMTFPKNMRWGGYELKFVRPIRWLVALFGEAVVPFSLAGVATGRTSRGHRFLGGEIEIEQPSAYLEQLRAQYVLADVREREALIVKQLDELAKTYNWSIAIKEDLLEEVLFLVEYPTALYGSFDAAFLEIPQDVLITSMREHQRYFPVLDAKGALLPYFVTVRNGDERSLEQVARGNEKVLRARLSDARFFYAEDQKLAISDALARLEQVVYHEELGTTGDKVRRIGGLTARLLEAIEADEATAFVAKRTAEICKFDLVTQMVYEFPELQGIMGEDYARKAGESAEVAKAINEHYQPRFSGDAAPGSLAGALVSVADKMDSIVGCFSIGIVPTGSQDPYALRRQAAGIVQIMISHQLNLSLGTLFELALDNLEQARGLKRGRSEIYAELHDFFALRVKNMLNEHGIRYDVIDAAMSVGFDQLGLTVARASAVFAAASGERREAFKQAVDAFNRVSNLAAKAETTTITPALFEQSTEGQLYAAWQRITPEVSRLLAAHEADGALAQLVMLQEPINQFFDEVMVMAEDQQVRANRLALLANISTDITRLADFSKIVW